MSTGKLVINGKTWGEFESAKRIKWIDDNEETFAHAWLVATKSRKSRFIM
nr:hypothetical protein [Enterococcus faecalis]